MYKQFAATVLVLKLFPFGCVFGVEFDVSFFFRLKLHFSLFVGCQHSQKGEVTEQGYCTCRSMCGAQNQALSFSYFCTHCSPFSVIQAFCCCSFLANTTFRTDLQEEKSEYSEDGATSSFQILYLGEVRLLLLQLLRRWILVVAYLERILFLLIIIGGIFFGCCCCCSFRDGVVLYTMQWFFMWLERKMSREVWCHCE